MEATPTAAAAAAAVVLRNENVEASHSAEEKITWPFLVPQEQGSNYGLPTHFFGYRHSTPKIK